MIANWDPKSVQESATEKKSLLKGRRSKSRSDFHLTFPLSKFGSRCKQCYSSIQITPSKIL